MGILLACGWLDGHPDTRYETSRRCGLLTPVTLNRVLSYRTVFASHRAMTSAISILFFSSMSMWPLP